MLTTRAATRATGQRMARAFTHSLARSPRLMPYPFCLGPLLALSILSHLSSSLPLCLCLSVSLSLLDSLFSHSSLALLPRSIHHHRLPGRRSPAEVQRRPLPTTLYMPSRAPVYGRGGGMGGAGGGMGGAGGGMGGGGGGADGGGGGAGESDVLVDEKEALASLSRRGSTASASFSSRLAWRVQGGLTEGSRNTNAKLMEGSRKAQGRLKEGSRKAQGRLAEASRRFSPGA